MAEPISIPHHQLGLEFRLDSVKGRGVFTTQTIPRRTLIDLSPVLLFPASEYDQHGKYTQLDHYTYKWQHGDMALALGLGSMFNHDKQPNVGFIRDYDNQLIKYMTLRDVGVGEELCISYGSNLWFEDANGDDTPDSEDEMAWMQTVMDG
ncbi:hypothetical protein BC941DRAFT_440905 [Chlamydoabsidia padenii]|nr:hypothetical protein BC941DRAFT_440905 [Chlamydoabsidia padenii]